MGKKKPKKKPERTHSHFNHLKRKWRMRKVPLLPPLTIKLPSIDLNTGESKTRLVKMSDFLNENFLSDKKYLREGTIKDVRRGIRLHSKFEDGEKTKAAFVLIGEDEWEILRGMCESGPTGGWNGYFGPQFITYIDAILEAEEVPDPKVEEKQPAPEAA